MTVISRMIDIRRNDQEINEWGLGCNTAGPIEANITTVLQGAVEWMD